MARSKLDIANKALAMLGARKITSFLEEDSVEADAINDVYDDILKEVLSEHPWSFAQKRIALTNVVPDDVSRTIEGRIFVPITITAATAAEPVVITAASHGLANGDRIKIVNVVGMTQLNGSYYRVSEVTQNTFELVDQYTEVDLDGSAYTAYTSGGQIYLANDDNPAPLLITAATAANPVVITSAAHGLADGDWIYIHGVLGMTNLNGNFYIVDNATTNTFSLQDTDEAAVSGLAYSAYTSGGQILVADEMPQTDTGEVVVYFKPSDMIKPVKKSVQQAFLQVEQDKIVSDTEDLKIKYTFLNTDTTKYFPKFVQALATRLAGEIAFRIINSVSKAEALKNEYHESALPSAASIDSTQGTPDEPMQDEWLDAQQSGGRTFVTTGETWHAA